MNVALYVRVSTQEQAKEGYSIGEQTERLTKYCQAHEWNIYNTYTDAGFTGSNMKRPALQQLIADVKKKRFEKVIVWKLDRLSRSQKDTLTIIEDILLFNDCDFVSMNENFDTATPFGKAMIGILAVFAQLEREQIKERMQMGKDARAKQGKWMGGQHIQFGYDYKDGELIINEYEAMIIREMFNLVLEGYSVHAIARTLNEKGYRTRETIWKDKTVRRMLDSKVYIGFIKYKKEWIPGTHEHIIDDDTFEKVQSILKKRYNAHLQTYDIKNLGKVSSYLGGLLVCANCGAKYTKNKLSKIKPKSKKRYEYNIYACNSRYSHGNKNLVKDPNCKNKSWHVEDLDALVFDEIRHLVTSAGSNDNNSAPDDRPDLIKKEISKLDDQIMRLMNLYQIGSIPIETIESKVNEIDDQKKQLEGILLDIKDEEKKKLDLKQSAEIAATLDDVLEEGDFDKIRKIILTLIDYIDIDGEDIGIHWNF